MTISFELNLNSSNEAFTDAPERELADILDELSQSVRRGRAGKFIMRDSNGNAVGTAFLEISDDSEAEA